MEDDHDAENLKNDIALQRLLAESHLLSKDASQGLDPRGKARIKALDIRLQALGSKDSFFAQDNVPMTIRKGITKKRQGKEEKRRREAKESGTILEKEVRKKKEIGKRDRGVGGPAVGRMKGGLLTLSKKDIIDIQGKKRQVVRKGKKR
jgi:uncharacterized protein DUF4602